MFQYATGLAAALDHDRELHLDTREHEKDRLRNFGLDAFSIAPSSANTRSTGIA